MIEVGSYVTVTDAELGRWEVVYIDRVGNYYLGQDNGTLLIKRLVDLRFDGHKPQFSEPVYFSYSKRPMQVRELFQ